LQCVGVTVFNQQITKSINRKMQDWSKLRERMVEKQLHRRGIRDARVLAAMRKVPRHEFIPFSCGSLAYDDDPVLIGAGQTISQPYMVAAMAEAQGGGLKSFANVDELVADLNAPD